MVTCLLSGGGGRHGNAGPWPSFPVLATLAPGTAVQRFDALRGVGGSSRAVFACEPQRPEVWITSSGGSEPSREEKDAVFSLAEVSPKA